MNTCISSILIYASNLNENLNTVESWSQPVLSTACRQKFHTKENKDRSLARP